MKRISNSSVTALPVLLTALALAAMADVTTFFPGPVDTGVPAYARIERAPDGKPLIHHDKDDRKTSSSTCLFVFNIRDAFKMRILRP